MFICLKRKLAWTLLIVALAYGWPSVFDAGARTRALSATPSPSSSPAPLDEQVYTEEVDRDFSLRSLGRLQVTNLRGGLTIRGWAQDKIRVKAIRSARAATREEAVALMKAVDFRYGEVDGDIELSAEYGKDLGIEDRLKERRDPRTTMEMVVYAPASLALRAWASEGKVVIHGWRASFDVRTTSGPIAISDVKGDGFSILCHSCAITVAHAQGNLRCMAGSGTVDLRSIRGKQLYVEGSSGAQSHEAIDADHQLYVSKQGEISGRRLRGRVEFHSGSGAVKLSEVSGFVSGKTDAGDIDIVMKRWIFTDRAFIETKTGNVNLSLPGGFSGDLDIWSVTGELNVELPILKQSVPKGEMGPQPANRLRGVLGKGGEPLRVFSQTGNIHLSRTR